MRAGLSGRWTIWREHGSLLPVTDDVSGQGAVNGH